MQAMLLALLCAMVPLDESKDDPVQKEMAKFQGVWKVTAVESQGALLPAERLKADIYTLVVVDNDFALSSLTGTLKLDPAKATADLAVTDGPLKGVTVLGRYELRGDTLRLVMHSPTLRGGREGERPAELKAGAGTANILYTLERDAKVTKEQAAARLKERKESLAPLARRGGPQNAGPGRVGGPGAPAQARTSTAQLLREVIERLDRIEKRLDAIEKQAAEKK